MTGHEIVSLIDHTLLKPEATREQILTIAEEAARLGTASACVNSYWVTAVKEALAGSGVLTCSVVGFPLGAMASQSVADETRRAVGDGADEIDMVIPVGLLRAGDHAGVSAYVETVRAACESQVLKVILETALLSDDEIVAACGLSVAAGADFVKTSTGFNAAGGATEHTVSLLRQSVGPDIGVKASGGVRSLADARLMIAAGASRIGMSATLALVEELKRESA